MKSQVEGVVGGLDNHLMFMDLLENGIKTTNFGTKAKIIVRKIRKIVF
jgi:hypothetical protein